MWRWPMTGRPEGPGGGFWWLSEVLGKMVLQRRRNGQKAAISTSRTANSVRDILKRRVFVIKERTLQGEMVNVSLGPIPAYIPVPS